MSFFDVLTETPVKPGEPYPMFTRVSIETTASCTRACSFCPIAHRGEKGTMSDPLYDSLVKQLAGFTGVVQWFFVNEPLLDRKRHERIAMLRAAAPKCCIHLTTNWDVMWRKSEAEQLAEVERLFAAGVNSLNLNDYEGRGYHWMLSRVNAKTGDHCWKRIRGRYFSVGPLPTKLHSWGKGRGAGHCARPHRHIVVMWNGLVPLCCAVDPHGAEIFGDANVQPLADIWQSDGFFRYRAHLQYGERVGSCSGCDETMAYPHVVRWVDDLWYRQTT